MKTVKQTLALALCLVALPAAAHGGHGDGFAAGLAHPFTGLDHLLAMLGVGMWSRQQRHGAALLPAFLLMMAAGALAPIALPWLELGIAASVALVGLMLLAALRLPLLAGVAAVGLFAFLHGQAHGRELHGAASGLGLLLASAALLAAGRWLGGATLRPLAGAVIGAAGLCLMAGASGFA